MAWLKNLLKEIKVKEVAHFIEQEITDFHSDSRLVNKGHLFVAIPGTQTDGHQYIESVIEKGCTAIICERLPELLVPHVSYILVPNSAQAYSLIAANYFNHPAEKLKIVGVTGTNGKTTTATLLYNLFQYLGLKAGLISTIKVRIDSAEKPAIYTTPDAKLLQSYFAEMVLAGCEYCFMEVSSHALVQERVFGVPFCGAIFTNITHDHLDFHKTFANYIKAKKLLFDHLGTEAFALINLDDRNGKVMLQNTVASSYTYAIQTIGDFHARVIESRLDGLELEIDNQSVWFQLIGKFNAYNILAVYGAACLLGLKSSEVLVALSGLKAIEGRFQTIPLPDNRVAIVDYAHTPDALENILTNLEELVLPETKIITVVGCGGDRDPYKRPDMGRIAALHSNFVILTSDNPRTEDPYQIIEQMYRGIAPEYRTQCLKIENRRAAIQRAVEMAQKGDIILIAGKGHETYQEIQGVRHEFDDRIEVLNAFNLNYPQR